MKKKIFLILLSVFTTLFFTNCGVSQDKYDDLLKKQEELKIQLQEVKQNYNNLQNEYDDLKNKYEDYKKEIGTIAQDTNTSDSTLNEESDYDVLQNLFLTLSLKSTQEDLENFIQQYGLVYTSEEYADDTVCYVVAFTEGSARQMHAESGDRLKVDFSLKDGTFMFAEYTSSTHSSSALLYNYGTWFYLNQEAPGEYTGYYVINPFSDKSGITIKYDNGNKTETNYFRCDSAKAALQQVLFS